MTSSAACVWITGGGSGVGAELAKRLAQSGEQVVISGRPAEDLREVAAGQPGILPFPMDTADSCAVRNGVQRIERDIAPISLAVLTSGAASPAPLSSFDRDRLRGQADAGVGGALNCLGALVPVLRQRGCGHVAILSPSGRGAGAPLAILVESLSRDLAGAGIKIQVIDPDLVKASFDALAMAKAAEEILRSLRTDQVAVREAHGLKGFFARLFSRKSR